MSIDQAVAEKIIEVLRSEGVCTHSEAEQICNRIVTAAKEELSDEIYELNETCEKLRQMNDRLWDAIDKLSEPRFPRIRRLFSLRWMKFWAR